MITLVSSLRTRHNRMSPGCCIIFRSFEIFSNRNSHWIGIQSQCSMKTHCFKKHSISYELYFKKILNCRGQLGSDGWVRVHLWVLDSFISARVTGQVFVRLKLSSKGNYPMDWHSNSMFYENLSLKKHSIWYELYFKNTSQRAARALTNEPSNARENVFERTPTTKKDECRAQSVDPSKVYREPIAYCLPRMLFCDSSHQQNEHERPDMKRKCMNTDKTQW